MEQGLLKSTSKNKIIAILVSLLLVLCLVPVQAFAELSDELELDVVTEEVQEEINIIQSMGEVPTTPDGGIQLMGAVGPGDPTGAGGAPSHDTYTEVTSIDMGDFFQEPIDGNLPSKSHSIKLNGGAITDFTVTVHWQYWDDTTDPSDPEWRNMPNGMTFVGGKQYVCRVYLNVPSDSGVIFPCNAFARYTGDLVNVKNEDTSFPTAVNPTKTGCMVVSEIFTCPEIQTITLYHMAELDDPVCFATPDMRVNDYTVPAEALYSFGGYWEVGDSENPATWERFDGTFQPGKYYRAVFSMEAKDGYKFSSSDTGITIDGWTVASKTVSGEDTHMSFTTAPKLVKPAQITNVIIAGTDEPVADKKVGDIHPAIGIVPTDAYSSHTFSVFHWVGEGEPIETAFNYPYSTYGMADTDWKLMTNEDAFIKGDYYKYIIDLNAKNGYVFDEYKLSMPNLRYENASSGTELYMESSALKCVPAPVVMLDGADQTWTRGSKEALRFRSSAPLETHIAVLVDGVELNEEQVVLSEGSTIADLQPAYLETLESKEHIVQIKSEDGIAEAKFTIKDAEDAGPTPESKGDLQETGDTSLLTMATFMIIAACGVIMMIVAHKRQAQFAYSRN